MKRTHGFATSVATATLTAAALGGSIGVSGAATATPAPTPTPVPPISTLAVRPTDHGQILVDGKGNTLYLFAADTSTTSTCTGACAVAWPPVTTTGGKPNLGTGLTASLVGTTKRPDGSTEVTYAGHPLYYFAGDKTAGQANGQNLDNFGAKWYVVGPQGTAVTAPSVTVTPTGPAQPTPTPTTGGGQPGY